MTRLLRSLSFVIVLLSCASGPEHRLEARRAGNVMTLPAGGDFQSAINNAQPGDTIVLAPGARYVGTFHLPNKPGSDWITIQTDASGSPALPAPGIRVRPEDAPAMAKLIAPSGSALIAEPGAHHFRFVGVEITPATSVFITNLIDLGSASTMEALAHHITFDRCYIHGDASKGGRRGIALNSGEASVLNSYLSDFKEVGADAQAIAGWNGPGPFHIVNNFIQASGENVLFGGADPSIADLVPSDIEILRNTITKPLTWRIGDPTYAGTPWSVKNLLELKNARRVRIEGNVLEYNWEHAQNGFAVLFTVRDQDGTAPWSVVEDVTFANNVVRHVGGVFNILGRDDNYPSQQAKRITIRNNLLEDVRSDWGSGRLFQLLNGAADVTIDHNTGVQQGTILVGDLLPTSGLVFQNNIAAHNEYGIIGTGTGVGRPSIDRYFPGAIVRRNVIAGGNSNLYPSDNFFPAKLDDVRWTDISVDNFRLAPDSPYKGRATDGADVGVDYNALQAALKQLLRATVPGQIAPASIDGEVTQASLWPMGWTTDDLTLARLSAIALFVALGLIAYAYAGYAGAIWLLAKIRPKPVRRRSITPTVSVVVVAYNEALRIEQRVANLLALDYPHERLEVVVASDGSDDATVTRAQAFAGGDRVRVIAFPVRRGKPAVLNDVIPQLRSEIVVLADARQQFEPHAVTALVECFGDPQVGAVSGELILRPAESEGAASEGAAAYWSYEKLVRRSESAVDSMVGATGAIYAIRRGLFEPIPDDTLLDDVLIPMRIARQARRVVFEPAARAYDRAPADAHEEFVRKVRTIAGNAQLFARERWLLRPSENRLWLQTVSHKAIRLLLPLLYSVAFLANASLVGLQAGFPYQVMMAAQVLFYAAAITAYVVPSARTVVPLLVVPYEICFLNCAAFVGLVRYFTGRQRVTWERTRPAAA
jgi:cellulose synthase/poly-beta-1,6-N-acetylglucosamine synthase-like glycosyltransferase